MTGRAVLVAFLLLAMACSAPEPPQPAAPGPGRIRPGVGIEEVSLGQERAAVEASLGAPEEVDRNEFSGGDSAFGLYYSRGIEIAYDAGKVSMITLHRAGDRWARYDGSTAEGLWVDSRPERIREVLGAPPTELAQALKYPDRGLWFRLDPEGKVEALSVLAPGR